MNRLRRTVEAVRRFCPLCLRRWRQWMIFPRMVKSAKILLCDRKSRRQRSLNVWLKVLFVPDPKKLMGSSSPGWSIFCLPDVEEVLGGNFAAAGMQSVFKWHMQYICWVKRRFRGVSSPLSDLLLECRNSRGWDNRTSTPPFDFRKHVREVKLTGCARG